MIFRIFFIFLAAVAFIGCASQPKPESLKVLPDQGPVSLQIRPSPGFEDVTDYKSRTVTKTFVNGEITRKISEAVDFTVNTKVTSVSADGSSATYKLSTLKKDGKSDLSDFAMPEVGESFDLILSKMGEVVKAGEFPPGTIYYVPPVSLPKYEVKIGDSWPFVAEWISLKSGVALKMELVSILKNLRDCGLAGACAEVEVSGDVSIVGAKVNNISPTSMDDKDLKIRFRSEISGRLLLSVARGQVLYSILRSDENLSGEKESVQVSSCMLTYVTEPNSVMKGSVDNCNPTAPLPTL
jgi:hypothetical protein